MFIYWIALLLTILLSKILTNENVKFGQNNFGRISHIKVFISFLPLFLVALFRWNVGVDVVYRTGYYYHAYSAIQSSLGNIFEYESGFYLLMKICDFFGMNLYLFYCLTTILFFVLFTKFVADNSKNVALSAIIFVLSDLYLFTFSTLRQTLGIAFAFYPITLMLKNDNFYKKAKWWFFLIISMSMHNTIIYIYLILLLSKIKLKKKTLLFITSIGCILSPFIQIILSKIISLTSYFEKYFETNMYENSFTLTYFLIALLLFIISLLNYKRIVSDNDKNYILINICAFTTILMANSQILIMPYRVFPLFIPFYIILCSKIIDGINKRSFKYLFTYVYLIIPFLFLFINQYYIGDGAENFIYKSIFEYKNQVWIK